jgi:hypothetical protein
MAIIPVLDSNDFFCDIKVAFASEEAKNPQEYGVPGKN